MITITAYDGTARPMFAMLIASVAPRPVWPMYRPIGSAIAVAARDRDRTDREVLERAGTGSRSRPASWRPWSAR